jgi:hypothetical protein
MSLIYRDDVGSRIIANLVNTTIPAGATISFVILKPDYSHTVTWSPTFDPVTGLCTYSTVAGDLNVAGEYKVQVYGLFVAGEKLLSNIDTFTVYDKLS